MSTPSTPSLSPSGVYVSSDRPHLAPPRLEFGTQFFSMQDTVWGSVTKRFTPRSRRTSVRGPHRTTLGTGS